MQVVLRMATDQRLCVNCVCWCTLDQMGFVFIPKFKQFLNNLTVCRNPAGNKNDNIDIVDQRYWSTKMIHLNSAIKTTAVIIRLEIVTPIQTVDDGSAGCNNYRVTTLNVTRIWINRLFGPAQTVWQFLPFLVTFHVVTRYGREIS